MDPSNTVVTVILVGGLHLYSLHQTRSFSLKVDTLPVIGQITSHVRNLRRRRGLTQQMACEQYSFDFQSEHSYISDNLVADQFSTEFAVQLPFEVNTWSSYDWTGLLVFMNRYKTEAAVVWCLLKTKESLLSRWRGCSLGKHADNLLVFELPSFLFRLR
jgi:hypothetical protein